MANVEVSDIALYDPIVINNTASNGGRMSTNKNMSGLTNKRWEGIDPDLAIAGAVLPRKGFFKNENTLDFPARNIRISLFKPVPGDIKLFLIAGTQTDIQSGIGSTKFGCGLLDSNVSAGASSIDVLVEDGTDILFRDGDEIVITDRPVRTIVGGGNLEHHVVDGTPTISGDVVTITLTGTLANDYSASNTVVMSLLPLGDLKTSIDTPVVSSAAGTFDTAEMTAHNVGGLYETWTFTFTSATAFTCAGDTLGSVGTGNIGSIFAPNNPAFGSPYYTVNPAAWGGTYQSGDTVTVLTGPAAKGFWESLVIPAGASDIQGFTRSLWAFGNG